ncbi:MAG: ATP-dependent DNA helicase [Myxococcota bacterium]
MTFSSAADLLGPDGPFAEVIPGWEARASQRAMAEAVELAFGEGHHLVLEAPTGVGKTLGYLLPAALAGRRVLVSTHTKTLQDQLLDKDIPRLASALERMDVQLLRAEAEGGRGFSASGPSGPRAEVRFAIMKGRSNYVCLDRLHRKTRQRSLPLMAPRHEDATELSARELIDEIELWARTSPRGDRAELPGLPEQSSVWDGLDARSETCTGTRCPKYGECFITRMRQEGENADLVVVNHHLLLADLALRARAELAGDRARFGQILPDADLLVIDEAHSLEDIAADHFGGVLGYAKVERLIRDVTQLAAGQVYLREPAGLVQAAARVGSAATATFAELPSGEGRNNLRPGDPAGAGLRAAAKRFSEVLGGLVERLEVEAAVEPAAEGLARRGEDVGAALRFVLEAEDADYVYWSEGHGAKGRLGASPVDVARILERFLFHRFESTVLTSATLSTGDAECTYFRRSVGVPEGGTALCLPSAFDYERQAALLIPEDAPEPGAPGALDRLGTLGAEAIRAVGGGALFLCTSHRAMRALHRQLAPQLPYPCLVQGERPKRALIAELVERAPAVLFATQSFWEGVDVPGDPLRLVLVDRLPFDVPTDPLVQARGHRLAAAGKNAFVHDQLPRAILRLKQGFGRLIRTATDRGAVVLLDGRLLKKGYGRRFLAALPPARRLQDVAELEAWWQSGED